MTEDRKLTVGDLRRAIADLHPDMPVLLEIWVEGPFDLDFEDLIQAEIESAEVEERCDETPCLYIKGDSR